MPSSLAVAMLRPLWLKLASFIIENVSLPPEVEQALDTRTKMGVIGDLNAYTKFQTANAIGDALRSEPVEAAVATPKTASVSKSIP